MSGLDENFPPPCKKNALTAIRKPAKQCNTNTLAHGMLSVPCGGGAAGKPLEKTTRQSHNENNATEPLHHDAQHMKATVREDADSRDSGFGSLYRDPADEFDECSRQSMMSELAGELMANLTAEERAAENALTKMIKGQVVPRRALADIKNSDSKKKQQQLEFDLALKKDTGSPHRNRPLFERRGQRLNASVMFDIETSTAASASSMSAGSTSPSTASMHSHSSRTSSCESLMETSTTSWNVSMRTMEPTSPSLLHDITESTIQQEVRYFHSAAESASRGPVRRTMSGFDQPSRKRSLDSSSMDLNSADLLTPPDRKRSRARQFDFDQQQAVAPVDDSLDSLDDDVFMNQILECSPNSTLGDTSMHSAYSSKSSALNVSRVSHMSVSMGSSFSQAPPSQEDDDAPSVASSCRLARALSTSVLEKGEYAKHGPHSPALPKTLTVVYSLQWVAQPQIESQAFRSIDGHVLVEQMLVLGLEAFKKKFTLIDCRYPYEYDGGHIKGAQNVHDPSLIGDVFYPEDEEQAALVRDTVPIFYCEYSQKRGPRMAHALRSIDRKRNELNYPEVDYPEIYLLNYGFKKFFEDRYEDHCEPPAYVPMHEDSFQDQLKTFRQHRNKRHQLNKEKGRAAAAAARAAAAGGSGRRSLRSMAAQGHGHASTETPPRSMRGSMFRSISTVATRLQFDDLNSTNEDGENDK